MTLLWSYHSLKINVFKQWLAFDIGKYLLWLTLATHDKLNILLAMFHNVLKAPTYNMSKLSWCSPVFNVVKEKDPKQYFGQKLILIHLIWIYCGIFCITMFIMSIYEFCLHINPENSWRYIYPNSCLNFAKLCKSLKKCI